MAGLADVAAAAPLLAGAFTLVRGATCLVLDLRDNIGGDPATVAVIIDWLAGGPPRHLFDVVYRDHTHQWWTAGSPVAEPPDAPVRALIGPRTASSGEALAWVLHDQRLATLVGQPTRGAADHVVPLALSHDVHALIPEARVVAPDGSPTWEGHGVQPDEIAARPSQPHNDTPAEDPDLRHQQGDSLDRRSATPAWRLQSGGSRMLSVKWGVVLGRSCRQEACPQARTMFDTPAATAW